MLVLANVAAPTPEQAERLGRLVREGMGLMIFTGAKLDIGLYNDLLYRQGSRLLPCALEEPGRREHPRADRRAAPPLAAGEAAGAEALGARAGRGPPDHGGGRADRQGPGPRAGPLERPGPVAGDRRAGRRRRPRPALDDHRRPRRQRLADRAELRPGGARGRPRRGAADLDGQHGHGRRADAAGRPLGPAGLERPAQPARRRRAAARCRPRPSPRTRATAPRPSRSRSPTPASRACTGSPGTRGRWATSRTPTRPTPTRARATSSGSRRPT